LFCSRRNPTQDPERFATQFWLSQKWSVGACNMSPDHNVMAAVTESASPPEFVSDGQGGWQLESRSDWGKSVDGAAAVAAKTSTWTAAAVPGCVGGKWHEDDDVVDFSDADWTPKVDHGFCCSDNQGNGTNHLADWLVPCCVADCFLAGVCEAMNFSSCPTNCAC
jgi:hypothetical protein